MNGRLEALARLTAVVILVVALPGRCDDVRRAPRCFVSVLTVGLGALPLLARLTARVDEVGVVAVRLASVLAPRRVVVAVLTPCTRVQPINHINFTAEETHSRT